MYIGSTCIPDTYNTHTSLLTTAAVYLDTIECHTKHKQTVMFALMSIWLRAEPKYYALSISGFIFYPGQTVCFTVRDFLDPRVFENAKQR